MNDPRNKKNDLHPNIFIRILMRYLISAFEKSKSHNFLGWGLYDAKKKTCYRLEIGLDNGHTLLKGRDDAIEELATTIYLSDSSDYLSAMWDALRALSPSIAQELENGTWKPSDEGDTQ